MEIQTIIVGLVILAALFYVGSLVWKKAKSFSTKSGCGSDCGCDSTAKTKNLMTQIKRS